MEFMIIIVAAIVLVAFFAIYFSSPKSPRAELKQMVDDKFEKHLSKPADPIAVPVVIAGAAVASVVAATATKPAPSPAAPSSSTSSSFPELPIANMFDDPPAKQHVAPISLPVQVEAPDNSSYRSHSSHDSHSNDSSSSYDSGSSSDCGGGRFGRRLKDSS